MISSVAKPLQNDYDTIIIDLLTRYGLDNRNVQHFVQTVAQQTRALRRIPKLLNPAKQNSNNKASVTESETQEDVTTKDEKRKPGFFSRLENVQNTYNKRGLLGVFFDYLKNKQPDTPAKEVSTDVFKNKQKDKTAPNLTRETKVKEEKNNLIERSLEKLEKYQEIFGKRGAIGVVQNIFKDFKSTRNNPLTQNATKITNNEQNINNNTVNRATTIGPKSLLPKAKGTEQELPLTDTEGQQSQKQNIFRKFTVVLGGIDEQGKKDFKGIFETVLQDFTTKQQKQTSRLQQPPPNEGYESAGGEGGLFDLITDIAMLRAMGSRVGAPKPGGSKWYKPWTWGRGKPGKPGIPGKPGRMPRLPGKFGGLSRLLGLFGLGAAAAGTAAQALPATPTPLPTTTTPPVTPSAPKPVTPPTPPPAASAPKPPSVPSAKPPAAPAPIKPGLPAPAASAGKGILSKAGGLLGKLALPVQTVLEAGGNVTESYDELSKRKDLSGFEKYGIGSAALAGAAPDVLSYLDPTTYFGGWGGFFGDEGLSGEALNAIGAKEEGLTMGQSLRKRGTEFVEQMHDIHAQYGDWGLGAFDNSINEKLAGKTKAQKQGYVLRDINKALTEDQWKMYGRGELPEKEFQQIINNYYTKQGKNDLIKPEGKPPVKVPKQATPEKKESTPLPKTSLPKAPDTIAAAIKPQDQISLPTTLTPKTTEILPSTPPSLTENNVTNNNADKQILSDIAGNTEKTNQNLNNLSQAVFALAKVFDSKSSSGGNSIIVNSGQGVKQYTSASQMSNSNNDTIRSIRRQFLAAIG